MGLALLARRGTTPAAPTSVSSSSFASFVGVGGGGERAEIDNINVRAAALHVVGDLVQSVGVIVASVVVWCAPHASEVSPRLQAGGASSPRVERSACASLREWMVGDV
jgi:hypothetical protein